MALAGFLTTAQTITGSHSDFPALLVAANFTNADANALDGTTFSNGGGNVIVYTDQTKTTRVPIEVVEFVTGGTPSVQIWAKHPSMQTGATFWVEADSVQVSQPAVTDTFGRNAVWSAYEAVIHANETGTNGVFVDSTGNGHDTTLTTGATLATTSANHPFGGVWPDFTTAEVLTLTNSYQAINNTAFSLSCWINIDVASQTNGVFGSRHSTGDVDWAQIQAGGRVFSFATSGSENRADGLFATASTSLVKMKQDATVLQCIENAVVDAQDTSVSLGESINNINSGNNFRVGTYFSNTSSFRYNGRAGEFRIKRSFDSSGFDSAEYDNQNTTSTFWTSSDWTTGGGITVTESTNNTNYTPNDPVITLTGSISISETLVNSNYTSLNPSISLTGVVSITEAISNTNYVSLNPVIDLTGLVSIVESLENTNYSSLNPLITLTSATVKITEKVVGAQYQARPPSILLTPPPLAIVSTVCFDGVIQDLSYNGSLQDLTYNGAINFVEFNGNMKELEFNGTIQTSCCDGSIKTDC